MIFLTPIFICNTNIDLSGFAYRKFYVNVVRLAFVRLTQPLPQITEKFRISRFFDNVFL